MKKSAETLKKQAATLLKEAKDIEIREQTDALTELSQKLADQVSEQAYRKSVELFTQLETQRQIVMNRKNAIETAGLSAIDPITQQAAFIEQKGNALFTFGNLRTGGIVTVNNQSFIVTDGKTAPSGNSYAVLPAVTKAWILGPEEKANPFNFKNVAWNYVSGVLTTAKGVGIPRDGRVIINDKQYFVKSSYIAPGNCQKYDLEPV